MFSVMLSVMFSVGIVDGSGMEGGTVDDGSVAIASMGVGSGVVGEDDVDGCSSNKFCEELL